MNKQDLIQLISVEGMIDYASLCSKEALELFPETLDNLLKEAEAHFDELLEMPENELSYKNFMDPFFTGDQDLNNLFKAIDSYNSTNSNEATRKIVSDFQPKLVDYYNKVSLSPELYEVLKKIEKQDLSADERRSLELVMRDMQVAGVHLPEEKREELKKINKKLSDLSEKFNNNVIDSKAEFSYELNDDASLKEMPEDDVEAARTEAKNRKSKAEFVFTLSPPSYIAIMRYCTDENIREIFHKANNTVATQGERDNRPLVLEMLNLREEKAKLLGFNHFAEYVLQERMAPSTEAVIKTLKEVNEIGGKEAQKNIEALRVYSGKTEIREWDLSFYAEKLKEEQYKIDDKALKPYFAFENVLEGLFNLTKKLFEIELKSIEITPYAEGAKAYEVFHKGELISYYFLDAFARAEKRPGAWANDIRSGYLKANGEKKLPVVINVCNFPQPSKNKPSLLTHRDVETIFHEFGHAIHVMLSSQNLPNLGGFHTEWDFVEAPSQILENWTWEYEVLSLFAKHYETGEVIPKEMVEKLKETKNFLSGLFLIRQNEFGFLDYLLHCEEVPKDLEQLDQKCREICNKYGALKKFEDYRMYASFTHVFAGGYSAGYYSYVWAEIMEADMYETFKDAGILNPEIGQKYVEKILAPGTKKPAMELFVDFTNRQPDIKALFKKHGIEA